MAGQRLKTTTPLFSLLTRKGSAGGWTEHSSHRLCLGKGCCRIAALNQSTRSSLLPNFPSLSSRDALLAALCHRILPAPGRKPRSTRSDPRLGKDPEVTVGGSRRERRLTGRPPAMLIDHGRAATKPKSPNRAPTFISPKPSNPSTNGEAGCAEAGGAEDDFSGRTCGAVGAHPSRHILVCLHTHTHAGFFSS